MRLMPFTKREPKSFTVVAGRRILDWTLGAFRQNGLDRFVYIGGYLIDMVRNGYPEFSMVENSNWANNNILFSLVCARDYMTGGFYSSYTDTLYKSDAVSALMASPHDITMVMDTRWRERYRLRSQHPESDGEKMITSGDNVVQLSRDIPPESASGEFTGVMRMTSQGAARFLEFHDRLYDKYAQDGIYANNHPFRMAYLIHQMELMIQAGIEVHCVDIPGDYHEIDTVEDYHLASDDWSRFA
jgi:choline kinase